MWKGALHIEPATFILDTKKIHICIIWSDRDLGNLEWGSEFQFFRLCSKLLEQICCVGSK